MTIHEPIRFELNGVDMILTRSDGHYRTPQGWASEYDIISALRRNPELCQRVLEALIPTRKENP